MSYNVGDLELSLRSVGKAETLSSLDNIINKLGVLSTTLKTITKDDFKWITTLGTKMKNFSARMNEIDWGKVQNGFSSLTTAITPFVDKIQSAQESLTALSTILQKVSGTKLSSLENIATQSRKQYGTITDSTYALNKYGKEYLQIQTITTKSEDGIVKITKTFNEQGKEIKKVTENIDSYGNKVKKISGSSTNKNNSILGALNFGVMATKLRMATYFVKRLGAGLATVVQYGSDYTETLNKWQVAMRYNLNDADAFIKKMRTAYGISTEMLMDTQSTFKNLLSGLGGISEATSYQLSESVTQMMLDFASLYNQTIESASSKFQAMISGQIRPVRAVSGIDVSETSIYDLYTRLGGTKTMRQLNQMEKRLLRIYATFEQMQYSGAIFDYENTIEQWANQSRIMTENWQELVTWMGIGVKELLESAQLLQYVNAALITATEIVKALVYAGGYEDEDFVTNRIFESTENTNEAIDELQGKLLDFDKFRTLEGSATASPLAIDQTVLDALASYNSQLGKTKYEAQKIADTWLNALGISKDVWYENEEGIKISAEEYENLSEEEQESYTPVQKYSGDIDKLIDKIKYLGITIGSVFGAVLLGKIVKFFLDPLNSGIFFITIGVGLLIDGIMKLIDGNIVDGLYLIAGAIAAIGIAISLLTKGPIPLLVGLAIGAVVAIGATIYKYWDKISKFFVETWEKVSKFFMQLINTIANGFIWFINKVIDGLNLLITPISMISNLFGGGDVKIGKWNASVDWGGVGTFAQGGMPDKGSLFIAGEAGAEMVVNNSNGQSAVMNMAQLQAAITNGMIKALSTVGDKDGNTIIKIGDEEVFTVVQKTAKRKGLTFARV